ncbi:MAG: S8 family serine peptidase [Proteobacteria bacterium]|nr:S8 family serine peptidase [Pseudomonadota bacterium]
MRLRIKTIVFIQSVLLSVIPIGYAGNLKVDPKIYWLQKNLLNLKAGSPPIFFAAPGRSDKNLGESDRLSVFIFPRDQGRAINEILFYGGKIQKVTPDLIAARVDFDAIFNLAGSDSIAFITPVNSLKPQLDVALPMIGADRVQQGLDTGGIPYLGKNVVTGLVDTGIDLFHPDFHHPDGSTRILRLWDQTQKNGPRPDGFDYGLECDSNLINRGGCGEEDGLFIDEIMTLGHGTHIASILSGSDPQYTGMAPEALIIAVKAKMDELSLLDGVDYLLARIAELELPAVINISLGTNEGAHDGSSPLEIELARRQGPGLIFVVSAGNEAADSTGLNLIHLGYAATSRPTYSRLSMDSIDLGNNPIIIELWYNPPAPDDFLQLALGAENTDHQEMFDQTEFSSGQTETIETDLMNGIQKIARISIDTPWEINPINLARQALITISPADPNAMFSGLRNYDWVLVTRTGGGGNPIPFDAWINSDNAVFSSFSGLGPEDSPSPSLNYIGGDDKKSLVIPATADGVFSVGSFVSRIEWVDLDGQTERRSGLLVGQISNFSSRGPTRDGRLKPEFLAPGEMIASAFSSQVANISGLMVDSYHSVLSGSSLAAPFVSGTLALMLERSPTLDFGKAFSLLSQHAILDAFTGSEPNSNGGYSKLNLDGVFADPGFPETRVPDTSAPVFSDVSVENGKTLISIAWKTNEISGSRMKIRREGDATADDVGTQSFTLEHQVEATGLLPGTKYLVKLISRDPSGNETETQEMKYRTRGEGDGCGCSSAGESGGTVSAIYILIGFLMIWILRKNAPFF